MRKPELGQPVIPECLVLGVAFGLFVCSQHAGIGAALLLLVGVWLFRKRASCAQAFVGHSEGEDVLGALGLGTSLTRRKCPLPNASR